jgi:hypothetical protein
LLEYCIGRVWATATTGLQPIRVWGRRNPSHRVLPPPSRRQPNPNGLSGLGLGEAQHLVLLPPLAAAPLVLPALGGSSPPINRTSCCVIQSSSSLPTLIFSHGITRSSLTSIFHASALPSSASRAGPSPPCRAALRAPVSLLPAEQRRARRPLSSPPRRPYAPALLLSRRYHVRPPKPHRH